MKEIVIKNGTLITAEKTFKADIKIIDQKIAQISESILTKKDTEIVDASDLFIIPGGIDPHTHFDLTVGTTHVSDGWEQGTIEAALGGVTTTIEHLSFGPEDCSLLYMIEKYLKRAENNCYIDYALHGIFQHFNQKTENQLRDAVKLGVSSFKAYMTYAGMLSEEDLFLALKACAKEKALLTIHAENNTICSHLNKKYLNENASPISHALARPDYAESLAVDTLLAFSKALDNAPLYIVHLSSKVALEKIKQAQDKGQKIIVETCPQYLILTDDCYNNNFSEALKYVMAPVPHKKEDQEALWKALNDGSISVVATDHCYFSWELKKEKSEGQNIFKCPGGIPGVETRNSILYSEGVLKNRISENKWVELISTNPAKIFGLQNKGDLKVNYDADIVLFNPKEERILSASSLYGLDYTPYENLKVVGWPQTVFLRGQKIIENNKVVLNKNSGCFVKRLPFEMNF